MGKLFTVILGVLKLQEGKIRFFSSNVEGTGLFWGTFSNQIEVTALLSLSALTHITRIRRDIALDSLQCIFNGPIHTCSVFRRKFQTKIVR